jgi:DNA polymerase-3 subunit gamma/tau
MPGRDGRAALAGAAERWPEAAADTDPAADPAADPAPPLHPEAETALDALSRLAEQIRADRDLRLANEIEAFVAPVQCRPGMLEFAPRPGAPADLAGRLSEALRRLTGLRWSVAVSAGPAAATLAERRRAAVADHPRVLAALAAFPTARVLAVRALDAGAEPEALAPAPDPADPLDLLDPAEAAGYILDPDDPFEEEL